MKEQIERLRDELRDDAEASSLELDSNYRESTEACVKVLDDVADRLTAILEADPVAKLEAMGGHVYPCHEADEDMGIILTLSGHEEFVCYGGPNFMFDYRDAAARLLARIDAPVGKGEANG